MDDRWTTVGEKLDDRLHAERAVRAVADGVVVNANNKNNTFNNKPICNHLIRDMLDGNDEASLNIMV
jgi:hypothetical protein